MSQTLNDWFLNQPATMPPLPATPGLQVPAGGMPALPQTPAPKPSIWARAKMPTQLPDSKMGISAAVVMQHFSRGEIRTLDKQSDALYAQVFARLKARAEFRKFTDRQIREVIKNVTYKLQSAEMTINFKAVNYFSTVNTWTEYQQMYSLGLQNVAQADGTTKSEMRLTDGFQNSALARDAADTKVTFGQNIATPGMQGVARFMQTGGLTAVGTNAAGATEFAASNPNFNPKARQQFAGLNYGRRPRGSAPSYGSSYFVLRDALKTNAIYYVGDTFTATDANSRVTYGMIFAVVLHAGEELLTDILNSCYRQMILDNIDIANRLIEGHIYQQIFFASDIKEMRVSEADINGGTGALLLTGKVDAAGLAAIRQTIKDNARKFATRNCIRLVWID